MSFTEVTARSRVAELLNRDEEDPEVQRMMDSFAKEKQPEADLSQEKTPDVLTAAEVTALLVDPPLLCGGFACERPAVWPDTDPKFCTQKCAARWAYDNYADVAARQAEEATQQAVQDAKAAHQDDDYQPNATCKVCGKQYDTWFTKHSAECCERCETLNATCPTCGSRVHLHDLERVYEDSGFHATEIVVCSHCIN